jgi:hypothetical protein
VVRRVGGGERPLATDGEERVQPASVAVDACQTGIGQLARADLPATEQIAGLGDGAIGEREAGGGHGA